GPTGLSLDDQVKAIELSANSKDSQGPRERAAIEPLVSPEVIWEWTRFGGMISRIGVFNQLVPEESAVGCGLVRDIFGDSRRLPRMEPQWRGTDVTAPARGLFQDPALGPPPLPADAPTDA